MTHAQPPLSISSTFGCVEGQLLGIEKQTRPHCATSNVLNTLHCRCSALNLLYTKGQYMLLHVCLGADTVIGY